MKRTKNWIVWLLTAALCLGLLAAPARAETICFVALNDNIPPISGDTIPIWSGGVLYVPYTIFDRTLVNNVDLGVYVSRSSTSVTLWNMRQILVFDLVTGACWDDISGEVFDYARAIVRNGRPYVPLQMVCDFFGLSCSYINLPQGDMVRIKSSDVGLNDAEFVDAAGDLINRRLREYSQSLTPDPTPAVPSDPPQTNLGDDPEEETSTGSVSTYLAFACESGAGIGEILDTLDGRDVYALFLLTPQVIAEEGDLVRRILGTGHSLGILAQGTGLEQTRALPEEGNQLLEALVRTRTTVACVPEGQQTALEREGWICWEETLALAPSDTVGANTFASNTLRRLEGRTRSTYLTMEGGENTARVLSSLLRQLENNSFVVTIPAETRL